MTAATKFSDRLRQLRKARNFSQRQLAELLGCDYTYISKLENGANDYPPKEHLLEQIARLFEVDAEELIFASGRIPDRYSGLLSELAVKYGRSLPTALRDLLERDR